MSAGDPGFCLLHKQWQPCGDCFPPAPEQQGDDRKCPVCGHWAHGSEECKALMRIADSPINGCRCVLPEEQQGEPCVWCGGKKSSALHVQHEQAMGQAWNPIVGHGLSASPAPPPSEEAEAREVLWNAYDDAIVEFTQARLYGPAHWNQDSGPVQDARKAVEAAIRRPIEEERDRLREELRIAQANSDTLSRVVDADGELDRAIARAEAAEAQVHELRTALAEALTDIKDGWKDSAATVIRRALAAHQEEGETAP